MTFRLSQITLSPHHLVKVEESTPMAITTLSEDDILVGSTGARPGAVGMLTDTTLCIGCKACEVACKQWNQLPMDNFGWTGHSYDNTGDLGATTGGTSPSSSASATAMGAGRHRSSRSRATD